MKDLSRRESEEFFDFAIFDGMGCGRLQSARSLYELFDHNRFDIYFFDTTLSDEKIVDGVLLFQGFNRTAEIPFDESIRRRLWGGRKCKSSFLDDLLS